MSSENLEWYGKLQYVIRNLEKLREDMLMHGGSVKQVEDTIYSLMEIVGEHHREYVAPLSSKVSINKTMGD